MKICPDCNSQNSDYIDYCKICGSTFVKNNLQENIETASKNIKRINSYFIRGIALLFCGGLPFGIIILYLIGKAKSRIELDDMKGALEIEKKIVMWMWIGIVFVLLLIITEAIRGRVYV